MQGALVLALQGLDLEPCSFEKWLFLISSQHKWIALMVDQLSVAFLDNDSWRVVLIKVQL